MDACIWFALGFASCLLTILLLSASVAGYKDRSKSIPRPPGQAVRLSQTHSRTAGRELPDVQPKPLGPKP